MVEYVVNVEVSDESDVVAVGMVDAENMTEEVVTVDEGEVWACRFNVIIPGPVSVTMVALFEPEQASPAEQLQLETTYPDGT